MKNTVYKNIYNKTLFAFVLGITVLCQSGYASDLEGEESNQRTAINYQELNSIVERAMANNNFKYQHLNTAVESFMNNPKKGTATSLTRDISEKAKQQKTDVLAIRKGPVEKYTVKRPGPNYSTLNKVVEKYLGSIRTRPIYNSQLDTTAARYQNRNFITIEEIMRELILRDVSNGN